MEEHAEGKFKCMQDLKKRFTVKIALAQKTGDTEQATKLDQEFKDAKKKCEAE